MSTQHSIFSSFGHQGDFDGDEANIHFPTMPIISLSLPHGADFDGDDMGEPSEAGPVDNQRNMTAVEMASVIREEYNKIFKEEEDEKETEESEETEAKEIESPKAVTMIKYTLPPKDKKQKRVKPELFDYLVMNVGYSKRLVKHMPAIQTEIFDVDPSLKLLAAFDYADKFKPPHDLYLYGEPDQEVIKELINLADGVGAIYFQGRFNHVDALGVQDVLKQFNHCGGFCHPNCIRRYFTSAGQKVLVMDYDTESG